MVLAPEHSLAKKIVSEDHSPLLDKYIEETQKKSDFDRTEVNKDKTGIFTGSYAINPFSGEKMEIWVADYVLISYGTGAIMAVPAHDDRDWEFATKYKLPIKEVVEGGDITKSAFTAKGNALLVNSEHSDTLSLNGLDVEVAIEKAIEFIEKNGLGSGTVNYKLRDWLFSRQRYWGEPFPIIHTEDGITTVDESDLPVRLPEVENYKPSDDGKSPLSTIDNWVEVKDTSGNIVGLRGTNYSHSGQVLVGIINDAQISNQRRVAKRMKTIGVGVIGTAFMGKAHSIAYAAAGSVLYDLGLLSTKEPFQKLYNQGMILGNDGSKMSKSKGNVINPEDIIEEYGADAMRLYEMFMGPLNKSKPWNTKGLQGCYRFVNKLWFIIVDEEGSLSSKIGAENTADKETLHLHHTTIKKVENDIENLVNKD